MQSIDDEAAITNHVHWKQVMQMKIIKPLVKSAESHRSMSVAVERSGVQREMKKRGEERARQSRATKFIIRGWQDSYDLRPKPHAPSDTFAQDSRARHRNLFGN